MSITKFEDVGKVLYLVIEGLKIPNYRARANINYSRTLFKDYPNNPGEALKEIPLNLKKSERYFASFVLGNYYSKIFQLMNEKQIELFLSGIANILKINEEIEGEIFDYLMLDVLDKMTAAKLSLSDIVKNISENKFSDIEKIYMFFVYGLSFTY